MKEKFILGVSIIIALATFSAWALNASAFETYDGCAGCHPGFQSQGALHDAHTAFTAGCTPCHETPGSTPVAIGSSGLGPGCTGCHLGDGLQQHHIAAEASACNSCHENIAPVSENTAPPYYGTSTTTIVDPCSSATPPGEDGFNDGGGLDNDGDLLYDEDDPDCAVPECTADEDCGDDNICNGVETCVDGTCQPGETLNCDDGDLCTNDSCDLVTGCANVPMECGTGEQCDPADGICKALPDCTVDADCDDGMFCNGVETCDAGTCVSGTPPDCSDGVACTVDTCDEVNDACVNTPDNAFCDDGDVCNGSETCDPVSDCQAGIELDCDDGDLCTIDSCDSLTGCANVPVECGAGETCDPGTGECLALPGCTEDTECDDGLFCNGAETCDAGTCQPGTPPDCDDGVECTVDTCDEVNDECVHTPDNSFCPDDGLFCTDQEICDPAAGCVSTGDPCPEGMACNEDTDTCDMVSEKATICHIPPGNPDKARTLSIHADSVAEHLEHGDYLGPCM